MLRPRRTLSGVCRLVALGALAAPGCRDRRDAVERRDTPVAVRESAVAAPARDAAPGAEAESDSGVVELTGPMVVAFFVATQAELDADPDAATAADDWQSYLPDIRDRLAARGVRLVTWTSDTLRVRERGAAGGERRLALADSGVGYVLLRPGAAPRILRGVDTGDGVLAEGAEYFGWGTTSRPPPRARPAARS